MREALESAQELLRRSQLAGEIAYPGADYDLAGGYFMLARVLSAAGGSEQALPLLNEAQKRFEAVARERASKAAERMASVCFKERGDCLRNLGRLDEAVIAYEESIRRAEIRGDDRSVAVGKGQLGSLRMDQRRYNAALEAYKEARERFMSLDEPASVAVSWHQTGMVHQKAGQPEAAEDAYRKSLAIEVRLGNLAGQADTLLQLGNLYYVILGRTEQAVTFYREAADKYVELGDAAKESRARNNLGETLRHLRRYEEARQEVRRAIQCEAHFGHASEPWKTWQTLADIEADAGRLDAASEAKQKAKEHYLAYRRDGGENHTSAGRICFDVTKALLTGDPAAAASLLEQLAADPDLPAWLRPFIQALQAIVAGSRDQTLADAPDLDFSRAAEILFLIETLENHQVASVPR